MAVSIFVSIASYRDPLLAFTIQRALETARHPERIHFGVVDQNTEPLDVSAKQLSYVRIDPAHARGPCWARAIAMSLYDGEDWFLQLDSHMDFEHWWDRLLINQAAHLPENVVLSSYPNPFVFVEGKPTPRPVAGRALVNVLRPNAKFEDGHSILKFEAHEVWTSVPIAGCHPAAGCLFARGKYALEFPYDAGYYFHGEEQALGLRLFTKGWDVVHPLSLPIYHLYIDKPTGIDARPLHWQDHQNWKDMEKRSYRRFDMLLAGGLGAYGLGEKRTLADFADCSGIDYQNRRIEAHAYSPIPV